jgi:hypothetical protein
MVEFNTLLNRYPDKLEISAKPLYFNDYLPKIECLKIQVRLYSVKAFCFRQVRSLIPNEPYLECKFPKLILIS